MVFEVESRSKHKAHGLHNRISRIVNDSLVFCADQYLLENIADNWVLQIDSMEIDIGEIDENDLEEETVTRFAKAFCEELAARIALLRVNPLQASEKATLQQTFKSKLQLLEHFLVTGTLIWWADKTTTWSMDVLIAELVHTQAGLLRELIIRVGRVEEVRKRIAWQFKEETVKQIIAVLEPEEAAYIFSYYDEVRHIQHKEQLIKTEEAVFARATLLFILNYLLVDRGSNFNRKAFVKNNISQVAAGFNTSYAILLRLFFEAINQELPPHIATGSLYDIIRQLFAEELITTEPIPAIAADHQPGEAQLSKINVLDSYINLARHYLLYGTLPAGAGTYSEAALQDMIGTVLKEAPGSFLFMLRSLATGHAIETRLLAMIGYHDKRLLQALVPQAYRFANGLLEVIAQVREQQKWDTGNTSDFTYRLRQKLVMQLLRLRVTEVTESMVIRTVTGILSPAYTIAPADLLQEIARVIKTRYAVLTERESLHQWIAQEIVLQGDAAEPLPALMINGTSKSRIIEPDNSVSLKDLLVFLLQYGSMPWWGKETGKGRSQQSLMELLIQLSPQEAVQVFRLAGTQANLRKRFLAYFTTELVVSIMSRTKAGKEAIDLFYGMMALIQRYPANLPVTPFQLSQLVMGQLWEVLVVHHYQYVNSSAFYAQLLPVLAAATGIESKEWVLFFQQTIPTTEEALYPAVLVAIIHEWSGEEYAATEKLKHLPERLAASMNLPAGAAAFSVQEVTEALLYFLRYGQLPAGMERNEAGIEEPVLVLQMLFYLFVHSPRELIPLWQEPGNDIRVKLYLYQLLAAQEDTQVQTLASFLVEERQKDMLQYFKEAAVVAQDQPGALLLNREASGNDMAILWEGVTIGYAKEVLQYFLQWNALPDTIHPYIKGAEAQQYLLRNLVTELYRQDEHAFIQAWENTNTHPLAKAQLYQLFNGYVQIHEQGVVHYLAAEYEKNKEMVTGASAPADTIIAIQSSQLAATVNLSLVAEPVKGLVVMANGIPLATARDVLLYFLQWNKLPDNIQAYIKGEEELRLLLRSIMVELFRQDEHLFANLWSTTATHTPARLFLYDTMTGYTQVHESALVIYLVSQREQELNNLLVNHAPEKNIPLTERIQQLLAGDGVDEVSAAWWKQLLASPAMLQQLAASLSMNTLLQLYQQKYPHQNPALIEWIANAYAYLQALVPDSYERHRWLEYYKRFTLLVITGRYTIGSGQAYMEGFFAWVYAIHPQLPIAVVTVFQQAIATPATTGESFPAWKSEMLRQLQVYLQKHTILQTTDNSPVITDPAGKRNEAIAHSQQLAWQQQERIRKETEAQKLQQQALLQQEVTAKAIAMNDKIYVANAGLVLLHPFFSTLFTRINYLSEGKFTSEEKQWRAALLLQYIAYGRVAHEEHEIVLNKLLCGISPETPVLMDFGITPEEEALVTEMFDVLFQRWDKMKNSTVAGFRASFLQREGALEKTEDGWNLRVEQRGYDLLLQTMPWAFGFIKTSWMHTILTTEWI